MLATIPLIAFVFLFAIARRHCLGRRWALLGATLTWGCLVVAISELLSLGHHLGRTSIAISWLLIDFVLFFIFIRRLSLFGSLQSVERISESADAVTEKLGWLDRLLCAGILTIFLLTGASALLSPSDNGDVLSYHLPRVAAWIANGGVQFFPTNDPRQLDQAPAAEYAVLQLHALTVGDRYDNLIQWAAFVLTGIFVSLIARELGASRRIEIVACAFTTTAPQAIVFSVMGKNDCVVACLLVAGVACLFVFRKSPSLATALGIGASVGLALLTKGTAYFYALCLFPILFPWRRGPGLSRAVRLLPLCIGLAALLNLGQWGRNYALSQNPLGPRRLYSVPFANETITPGSTFVALLKVAAVHLRMPGTALTPALERGVQRIGRFVGIDVDDPKANWSGAKFYIPVRIDSENYPSNRWHFALILMTLVVLCFPKAREQLGLLSFGLILSFVLMSAVLRWQTGFARFHIPWFALWSVPVALALSRVVGQRRLALVLLIFMVPAIWLTVSGPHRSLIPGVKDNLITSSREDRYFVRRPDLREPLREVARLINARGCSELNIAAGLDQHEYPLLYLVGADAGQMPFRYYGVVHRSAKYATRQDEAHPCALVCLTCTDEEISRYSAAATESYRFGRVNLFVSKNANSP